MYKRPDCTNSQSLVYNIFSHNIRLIFIPWAADQKFEVSGALGGDPQPVQPNIHYPHIVIPTDELEKSRQRADSMLAKLDKTPSLIRESELANRKMNTIDLEHRDDINLVNNTCSNAKIKLYPFATDLSSDLGLNANGEFYAVNMTTDDSRRIANFLAAELGALNPMILCPAHDKLQAESLSGCDLCLMRNTPESSRQHESRYFHLWDQVTLLDDEAVMNGGSSIIRIKNTFDRPLDTFGQLKHSNLNDAKQASCLRLFNGGNNERGYLSYLPFQLNHAAANSPSFQAKPCLFWFTFRLRRHMAAVTASSIKCQHQSETSMQLKFPRASFDSFAPFRGDVYDAHTFNHNVNYPTRPQAALT